MHPPLRMSPTRLVLAAIALTASPAAAEPPHVLSAAPDHGDTGVDPALSELRFEFDQDMSPGGRSICGGGETFPEITAPPHWQSPRILLIPVHLKPEHRFNLSINCPSAQNFRSATGEPAEITPISFSTAAPGHAAPVAAPLTPDQNRAALDALRRAIDTRYSYRDRIVTDWDALFSRLNTTALPATSRAGFARAVARELAAAQDVHFSLIVGDARFPTHRRNVTPNVDPDVLAAGVPHYTRHNNIVATGRFDDGTLYLEIDALPAPTDPALAPAFEALKSLDKAPAVIIDVRLNGGGDEAAAQKIASYFTGADTVYSRDRIRDPDSPGGWTPTFDRTVRASPTPFRGRVAVLMGPACVSSCESFLLMMRHGAHATLVGETSGGSSGRPMPIELGNGVTALVPSWEDLLPDGTGSEGRGVQPDVTVSALPGAQRDATLKTAVDRLRAADKAH